MKTQTLSLLAALVGLSSAAATSSKYVSFTQDERGTAMAHVKTNTAELFPGSPADLSGFDIDTGYTNYDEAFFHGIADGLSSNSTEDKVGAVVGALYHKTFQQGADADMEEDYNRLLQAVDPVTASDLVARNSYISWATSHAIKLTTCAGFLSCISGTSCNFYVTIDKAPRSRCENQGGQNCCMTWANYNVKAATTRGLTTPRAARATTTALGMAVMSASATALVVALKVPTYRRGSAF